jgi:DNA-binding NarL/FixJ family response regulator
MAKTQILVVEDESIVAKDIQKTLHNLGYDVPCVVSSGQAAIEAAQKNKSLVCVGLDPDPGLMPDNVSILEFNKAIIDATSDLVCAYKLNFTPYTGFYRRTCWTNKVNSIMSKPAEIFIKRYLILTKALSRPVV